MVRICATGNPPLASRNAAVMGATSVRGSAWLRTNHHSGATRELSAVSRSGICASGMYIMGVGSDSRAAIMGIAHNANNLARTFRKRRAGAGANQNLVFQRIAIRPILRAIASLIITTPGAAALSCCVKMRPRRSGILRVLK